MYRIYLVTWRSSESIVWTKLPVWAACLLSLHVFAITLFFQKKMEKRCRILSLIVKNFTGWIDDFSRDLFLILGCAVSIGCLSVGSVLLVYWYLYWSLHSWTVMKNVSLCRSLGLKVWVLLKLNTFTQECLMRFSGCLQWIF